MYVNCCLSMNETCMSDGDYTGGCLCDCPIYAEIENMLMHFIVGDSICVASPGVSVCVATPNPAGFY